MYDKDRHDEIVTKSTIELIVFLIVRAVHLRNDRSSIGVDCVFDNEFIWAQEELEKRINKLEGKDKP